MYSFEELSSLVASDITELELPLQPANLYEPITYTLASGGKRIRPVSLLMGCNVFSDDLTHARRAAMAVEMFHNFTLLHDDIMDNAAMRRGQDTVHKKWCSNVAILSGDVMLVYAYKLLTECQAGLLPELIRVFNQLGVHVCEGQQYDMDFEKRDDVSVQEYIQMIKGKTAALLGGSIKMGALCGGASEEEAETMMRFGVDIGVAFQLQDDLLDTYADPKVFGKPVGGDIIENKKTFLLTTALETADAKQRVKLLDILNKKNLPADLKIAGVKDMYDKLGIREITELAIESYFDSAVSVLDKLKVDKERLEPLKSLAAYLLKRNK